MVTAFNLAPLNRLNTLLPEHPTGVTLPVIYNGVAAAAMLIAIMMLGRLGANI